MENTIFPLLFPHFCLGCGYIGSYICPRCEEKMVRAKQQFCIYCGRKSLFGLTHPTCKRKHGVDGYVSLYSYKGIFTKLLHEAKYKGAHLVLTELVKYNHPQLSNIITALKYLFSPTVMSVPLHYRRMQERGFNQSDIIAKYLFPTTLFPHGAFLKRIVNTPHLANLDKPRLRRAQIARSFSLSYTPLPHSIIIVDDVLTSGSTAFECARTLKQNGVKNVFVFSLAKG